MNRIGVGVSIGVLLAIGVGVAVRFATRLPEKESAHPTRPAIDSIAAEPSPSRSEAAPTQSKSSDDSIRPENEFEDANYVRWQKEIVASLVARDDADALMSAAVLLFRDHSRSMALLERAAAFAPNEPAIRWLMLMQCKSNKSCDSIAYENALRAVDPQNGFGWFGALERAEKESDSAAIESALADVAARKRFDIYVVKIDSALIATTNEARVPPPNLSSVQYAPSPSEAANYLSVGVIAALPLPAMRSVTDPCGHSATEAVRASCKRIGESMRNADSALVQMIGASLRGKWAPPGSDEYKDYSETRRRYQWVQHNLDPNLISIEHVQAMQNTAGGEMQGYLAILKEVGIPLEPPDDWQPPQPAER